jgi:hypothetical protein
MQIGVPKLSRSIHAPTSILLLEIIIGPAPIMIDAHSTATCERNLQTRLTYRVSSPARLWPSGGQVPPGKLSQTSGSVACGNMLDHRSCSLD